MTEVNTAEDEIESVGIALEDDIAAREQMLKHLPKLYELMLDIPGTHRDRMFHVLRALLQGLP